MTLLKGAALLGGASVLAMGLGLGQAVAETARAAQRFDIASKPLLAALADYTAATGVQVVRPGAQRLDRPAPALAGEHDPEAALQTLLAGSGLVAEFVGPRTATLRPVGAALEPVQLAGESSYLEQIDVVGQAGGGRRSEGGDGRYDVTAEDIERKQPNDIRDVFAGEPGIQVGGSIPLSQKVYVHGVEENNLAVSIDGAPQNNKIFHHNATTVIDPSLLKAARVDAGVAPADAGFGALAGSIAYETKDVADLLGPEIAPVPGLITKDGAVAAEPKDWGGFAKSSFNTNGDVFGQNVGLYGRKNGFEAFGFFNIARGGKYQAGNGDTVDGTKTHLTSGLGKLAYEADTGHRFEISHERVSDDALRPFRANAGEIEIAGRVGEPNVRRYDLERQNTVLTYSDTTPEGWWDPKVVLSYSKTKLSDVPTYEWTGALTPIGERIFAYARDVTGDTSTYSGRAENKFAFDKGTVVAGVEFRRDRAEVDYDPVGVTLPADETSTVAGLFAQARLEPIERARLSFGGRADHQRFRGTNDSDGADKNHSGLSGNVSGEYDLIPDLLTAKAGYSHVWAGIPLAENFILNPDWVYRDAAGKLKATVSDNVTAGLVARRNGFTVEGSVFATDIKNARNAKFSNFYDYDFGGTANGPVPGATWAPDLETRGFEIGAGYAWETGFVRAKFVSIDVKINGRDADSDTGNYIATPVGDIFAISAAHTFVAWNVTVGGDVEIAPKYDRAGRDPATGVKYPAYKAYQIVNAFLEWKPSFTRFETTFRIDAKNLFDETYSSRATYGSEFGNVTPLFEPGRAVILSAAVKF